MPGRPDPGRPPEDARLLTAFCLGITMGVVLSLIVQLIYWSFQ